MKARLALSLLIASLPLRGASAQVETALPAEGAAGGNSSAAAASLDSPPAPVALAVPALSAAPMSAPPPAALAAAPAAAAAPPLSPALAAPADLPLAAASPATEAGPPLHGASASSPRDAASRGADEPSVAQGRALFDAAAPAKDDGSGFWAALKGWAGLGDRLPSWPGAAGEKIRLGGRTFTLGRALAAGADSREWRTERGDDVVKLLRPDPAAAARDRAAAETLRALKGSDIPHAGLIAASADGRALVEEFIEGPGASELLAKGFETRHRLGWAELGARLIRAGVAADLSPGNLVWQHWRTRWTILDASAVEKAAPEKVLSQLLTPAARRAGVDGAEFLAGLRARLGPDSHEWSRTAAALRSSPRFAADLEALAARDRALPPAPEAVFGPGAGREPFPDEVRPARDAAAALGYDPLAARPRRALHADDPGKLNTEVFAVEPPGRTPAAVKIADWGMIRRELAVRRVIRRWFGRWFDEPSAFGVKAGARSYLVMELKAGERSYGSNPLSLERRAALAVLVHAFGLGDVNPGNVLFPPRGKPVLLDFEVALNRRRPNAGRLPDEGIALEMPWMSRFELNRAEDYQPAARAWRALLARPESKRALLSDFAAAGYSARESAGLLAVVEANTAELDWAISDDADFVNQFAARRAAVPR